MDGAIVTRVEAWPRGQDALAKYAPHGRPVQRIGEVTCVPLTDELFAFRLARIKF